MKSYFEIFILLSFLLIGCIPNDGKESPIPDELSSPVIIPSLTIPLENIKYDNRKSIWKLNGHLFSGYATSYYEDGTTKQKSSFYNGKKEGESILWHSNGKIRQIANYKQGKLNGFKEVWSSNKDHTLLSQLNYQKGKPHGEQKIWYPTGELHKLLNLNMGKEEGLQKAFRKNGVLYANYEAVNGRVFGLKKASLCFGLEDEKMSIEN